MIPVSVVMITKNEGGIIADSIRMAKLITDDIVIVDNGSTDNTLSIAAEYGCRIYQKAWDGYGANKNKGIELARYDWILSLDADEIAGVDLIHAIHNLGFDDPRVVYDIKYRSYFGKKLIRFGKWGRDHHVRLFNRTLVKWTDSPVHETLLFPAKVKTKRLSGYIHHYSVNNNTECQSKAVYYAKLSAQSCYQTGKKATFTKLYLSPAFNFIKNYILFLGFLDGAEGLAIAKAAIKHTRLKYLFLKKMETNKKSKYFQNQKLVYAYATDKQLT